jgi:hypothetical protein
MPSKSGAEQPRSSRSDVERDLGDIDKLKDDFDQELSKSDKSGDFSTSFKLKQQIDDRIAALKARMETVRAFESQPSQRPDLEFAKQLFDRDYIGPETISGVWGIEIQPEQVPQIPFSEVELDAAKQAGQFLILRSRNAQDGKPLTMLKMHEILTPRMGVRNRGKVFFTPIDQWRLDSDFFTKDTPVGSGKPDFAWALTSKEILDNSTMKNYVGQTDRLAVYIENELFIGQPPDAYQEALSEYRAYLRTRFGSKNDLAIQQELDTARDWRGYARDLTRLKINQLLRQTPAQALFDMATLYEDQDIELLPKVSAWTNATSRDGFIIDFGGAGFTQGPALARWRPGHAHFRMGVLPSRTS